MPPPARAPAPRRSASRILGALAVPCLAAVLLWPSAARPQPAGNAAAAEVRVGRRAVLSLRGPARLETPTERAARANRAIDDALLDPECPSERWSSEPSGADVVLRVCSYSVLIVTSADAASEGLGTPEELAAQWLSHLREAFDAEKQAAFSARLLRRAVLGFLLPLGYLGLLALTRLLSDRWRKRLTEPPAEKFGVRLGPLRLLTSMLERTVLAQIVRVLKWVAYALLTYGFAVVLFRQFPRTARWARQMLEPLAGMWDRLGEGAIRFLPRLPLILLVLILMRLLLQALGRLFRRVREGSLRVEPYLSSDTAGPAELTARALVVGVGLLALGLLLPGEFGVVVLSLFGLTALTLALGSWDAAASLIAGMVLLYGRPFRRGQRVRAGELEGLVADKGLLHLKLETEEGRTVLVPNRLLLARPIQIVERGRSMLLRVTVRAPGGPEAAAGLCRHAASETGLKREEGKIVLVELRQGALVLDVEWPVSKGETPASLRYKFIAALLARAPGLDIELVSVEPHPTP